MAVVVFRGLLSSPNGESVIRESEPFRLAGSQSSVLKSFLNEDTFESAILGHSRLDIPQGPLSVAAMGWDPPDRSTHFAISVLSAQDGAISQTAPLPTDEEAAILSRELPRLNTKSITVLFGEGIEHALVWERRVDMLTHPPSKASELGLGAALPEGDLENDLRRMIDDSINLLSEQEFNIRRIDRGVQPLNLVWPWGQGERQSVTNMTLKLGYPWRVFSNSLAIRGYARLSGFRSEKLPELSRLVESLMNDPQSLAVIDFSRLASEEKLEEKAYMADALGCKLVMPLLDWHATSASPLCFVATNPSDHAVIAHVQGKPSDRDAFPFDERALEERKVGELALTHLLQLASA